MPLGKGLVQVYTGEGKGKTSAALGLALRAVGQGLKVYIIQFLKGSPTGELNSAKKLGTYLKVEQFAKKPPRQKRPGIWLKKGKVSAEDKILAQKALAKAGEVLRQQKYDIVILDEVNMALDFNLLQLKQVLRLIKEKPASVELILTGRRAPQKIIEAADLVTEMRKVKHPFDQGVGVRKGIEY